MKRLERNDDENVGSSSTVIIPDAVGVTRGVGVVVNTNKALPSSNGSDDSDEGGRMTAGVVENSSVGMTTSCRILSVWLLEKLSVKTPRTLVGWKVISTSCWEVYTSGSAGVLYRCDAVAKKSTLTVASE